MTERTERLGHTRGNFWKLKTQNLPYLAYFAVSATDSTAETGQLLAP